MTDQTLIDQAERLVTALEEAANDLCGDWQAEGCFPPAVMRYHTRINHAYSRAVARLKRRDGTDPMDEAAYWAEYRRARSELTPA